MKTLATTRIALRALRRNRLRSLLTMLGIIIGVAAVIAMVAVGSGAQERIQQQIASIGSNVIIHAGTEIGSDGFGFIPGENGHLKIPQLGIVEIGDAVTVFEADGITPAGDGVFLGQIAIDLPDVQIRLDDGSIVHGYECWWIAKKFLA